MYLFRFTLQRHVVGQTAYHLKTKSVEKCSAIVYLFLFDQIHAILYTQKYKCKSVDVLSFHS